tara:strand:- start:12 stop:2378 length:2367 start_codon:yes stop_codon:yes gene_type:complete
MGYFRELPNIEYVNRFKGSKSNDEVTVAKNLFRRTKLREDLEKVFTTFDFYKIEENERPDQVAKKVYNDSSLDWVVKIVNNIQDYYNDWPLNNSELHNYMMEKYGSEEKLQEVHHYETLQTLDAFGRLLVPAGLTVDKTYYDAPEYEIVQTTPPGVVFPVITLPGIGATIVPTIQNFEVNGASISSAGRGYPRNPKIGFAPPPTTIQATATVEIEDFHISGFSTTVGFNTGKGYRTPPIVSITDPFPSRNATADASLDTGPGQSSGSGRVTQIDITDAGIGYGLTAPSLEVSLPPNYVIGARFQKKSPIGLGSDVDGMAIKPDGYKIYTTSMTGSNQVKEFYLTTPWDIDTVAAGPTLDVSGQFSYCNGIDVTNNGSALFVTGGQSGTQKVAYYQLVIAWDLSSAIYSTSFTLDAPGGVRFSGDGLKMFILDGNNPDSIKTYNLTNPYNISSPSLLSTTTLGNIVQDFDLVGFSFGDDGKKLYVVGQDSGSVHGFDLDTAYDLSSINNSETIYVANKVGDPNDVFVRDDNKETIWIMGGSDNKVGQYRNRSKAQAFTTIDNLGRVNSINITQTGFGYTVAPQVTIGAPFPQVSAAATAIITQGENGFHVTSFDITQAGFGYTVAPQVTIGPPPPFRTATGITSFKDGQIVSVTITNPGTNYYEVPAVSFDIEPEPIVVTNVGDIYSSNNKVYRWNGTNWELQLTKAFEYLDSQGVIQELKGNKVARPVSNYEYEVIRNDEKRIIRLPKPGFIELIQDDLRRAMKYDTKLDTTINSKLTRAYNPKLSGI